MSVFAGLGLACVRGERMVFAGLDFRLQAGGALLLRGPNGSGKSSLLRLMAGLIGPAAGRLTWDGAGLDEDREAHARRLHFLGHLDAVKPVLSVEENLTLWAGLRAPDPRVEAALAGFGLEPLAGLPARFLSAGQRRRLALARIAATHAPLWLLDEPAAALDDASVERLAEVIAGHRAAGGMVVVAAHGGGLDLPGAVPLALDQFAASEAGAAG